MVDTYDSVIKTNIVNQTSEQWIIAPMKSRYDFNISEAQHDCTVEAGRDANTTPPWYNNLIPIGNQYKTRVSFSSPIGSLLYSTIHAKREHPPNRVVLPRHFQRSSGLLAHSLPSSTRLCFFFSLSFSFPIILSLIVVLVLLHLLLAVVIVFDDLET